MLNGITLGIIITCLLFFFCIILSILVNALLSPMVKTPKDILDEIADIMNINKKDVFVDLGSGDGRLVLDVYGRAMCKCIGYEISPLLLMFSNIKRVLRFPTSKGILFDAQNIFKVDISNATKIYCYLDERSMDILKPKLMEFVKKGGEVYSYGIGFKDVKNEKKITLKNKKNLYIYKK